MRLIDHAPVQSSPTANAAFLKLACTYFKAAFSHKHSAKLHALSDDLVVNHCTWGIMTTRSMTTLQMEFQWTYRKLEIRPHVNNCNSWHSWVCKCQSIMQSLPDSVGELSRLQVINLSGCAALESLPESIGNLDSLTELDLCGCTALSHLPETLGRCLSLAWMDLNRCRSLQVTILFCSMHYLEFHIIVWSPATQA